MNSAIVSNINGGTSYQQLYHESHSALVQSPIEFTLTEVQTNASNSGHQGKYLSLLPNREDTFNGQEKTKNVDKDFEIDEVFNVGRSLNGEQTKSFQNKVKDAEQRNGISGKEDICNGRVKPRNGEHHKTSSSKEEICNGQIKAKNCDQNKNSLEDSYLSMNGNRDEDSMPVPKVHLYTGRINVEWCRKYKIGAGLNNLGNSCFMNTVIQCLTYCPPLANYLLHDNDHSNKCSISGFCMMCLLQKHMRKTIGKTGEVVRPTDVFDCLRHIAKHFRFGQQEDAHEFLRYVIDHLWKSCLPNGLTKLDPASKETTVINKIFGGYHRSQVICMRCKKESSTYDHFMDFILDIKQNISSLEMALQKYIQPELLQQENCYKCVKCKMKVEAQKRFSVHRAPTVATFQLKRFDYNRYLGGKITKQISYPEKLNLRPYMSESKGEPVWYRLNSVLVHSGQTCNSGHYYCYVRNSDGLWYKMDDQTVQQVSLHQVLNQSAYVLFYIKVRNTEGPLFKKCFDKNAVAKGGMSNFTKETAIKPHVTATQVPVRSPKWPSFVKLNGSGDLNKKKNQSLSNQENILQITNSNHHSSSNGREKIPLGAQTNCGNSSNSSATFSKNNTMSSVPSQNSGLVPYVEDSSESSDTATEGNRTPVRKYNNGGVENQYKYTNNFDQVANRKSTNGGVENRFKYTNSFDQVSNKKSISGLGSPSHSHVAAKTNSSVNGTNTGVEKGSDFSNSSLEQSSTKEKSTSGLGSPSYLPVSHTKTSSVHINNTDVVNRFRYNSSFEQQQNNKKSNSVDSNSRKWLETDIPTSPVCRRSGAASATTTIDGSSDHNSSTPEPKVSKNRQPFDTSKSTTTEHTLSTSKTHSPTRNSINDGSSSSNNCDFRRNLASNSTDSSDDDDERRPSINVSLKRKLSESNNSQVKQQLTPVYKQIKYSHHVVEWAEPGAKNDDGANVSGSNSRTFSDCDSVRNSGRPMVNGVSSTSPGSKDSSSRNSSASRKKDREREDYSNSKHLAKEKSNFIQGKNSSLYGAEVPTWREDSHYRPSMNSNLEKRRTFDYYDQDFDRGKVRKSKTRDRHRYFHTKNPFQKYSDRHHHSNRYGNKFYGNHRRKYDSRPNWKHHNSYNQNQRYNNHHRHY